MKHLWHYPVHLNGCVQRAYCPLNVTEVIIIIVDTKQSIVTTAYEHTVCLPLLLKEDGL